MYYYKGCGLRNIYLRNGYTFRDTSYGPSVAIHDVEGLHKAIGLYLVEDKPGLTGAEVRFLRKELDMGQSQLSIVLGVGESTVRNWEHGRVKIPSPPERMLRLLYHEHVNGDGTVRALIERISQINRDVHSGRLELSESAMGWTALAA